jgi:hypothetical protein
MLPVKLFPVHGVEDRGIVHLPLPRHAFRYFPTPYRDTTEPIVTCVRNAIETVVRMGVASVVGIVADYHATSRHPPFWNPFPKFLMAHLWPAGSKRRAERTVSSSHSKQVR